MKEQQKHTELLVVIFFSEIENLLNKGNINVRKFGWLYKENFLSENDVKNETKNEVEMN